MKSLVPKTFLVCLATIQYGVATQQLRVVDHRDDTSSSGGHFRHLQSCQTNEDCGNQDFYYCAAGVCMEHGSCSTVLDCKNPSNFYFLAACVGYVSCYDDGFCGIECTESNCGPTEGEYTECSFEPCAVNSCSDAPSALCVNDYCGGCKTIFFDSAGREVCKGQASSCVDDRECGDGLCVAGECAPDEAEGEESLCPCEGSGFMAMLCYFFNSSKCK